VAEKSFRQWKGPCPLCGALDCAKFLGFYQRQRIYFRDTVFENVSVIRFTCCRHNPVSPGTHRTFSLLPCPLIPNSPYSIQSTLEVTAALEDHSGNAYQTAKALDLLYETMNPEQAAIDRMGLCVREAIDKLNRLPEEIVKAIDWPISLPSSGVSEFISFTEHYQSQVLAHASGAEALSYDYFHVFQKDLPCMQRRFLFGTPSQSYLSPR
jgi:hypothetical protein